jgi:hypothetical protein
MRILIKYATRGRPEWFRKTIANIFDTIGTSDFKILVSADLDDASMRTPDIYEFIKNLDKTEVIFDLSASKIHAINRDMEHSGPWDILVNMSDDMQFVKPRWDELMIARIKEVWGDSLDFFAHFNDGYVGDALSTLSIMGFDYYKRDGYIYYPEYKSFSCDAEAMYVAMMRGRHHYFNDVLFLHQHPANKPGPRDETYRKNSLVSDHDEKVYWRRLNSYFDIPEHERLCVPFKQFLGQNV